MPNPPSQFRNRSLWLPTSTIEHLVADSTISESAIWVEEKVFEGGGRTAELTWEQTFDSAVVKWPSLNWEMCAAAYSRPVWRCPTRSCGSWVYMIARAQMLVHLSMHELVACAVYRFPYGTQEFSLELVCSGDTICSPAAALAHLTSQTGTVDHLWNSDVETSRARRLQSRSSSSSSPSSSTSSAAETSRAATTRAAAVSLANSDSAVPDPSWAELSREYQVVDGPVGSEFRILLVVERAPILYQLRLIVPVSMLRITSPTLRRLGVASRTY